MTVTIRQLHLEESIKILHLLNNYAFRPTPPLPNYDDFAERVQGRNGGDYIGVFENENPRQSVQLFSLNRISVAGSFQWAESQTWQPILQHAVKDMYGH